MAVQNVAPGSKLNVNIGQGGFPCWSGERTTIQVPSPFNDIIALSGIGADATRPGHETYLPTTGGRYIQYAGQPGSANTNTYAQKSATSFATIRKYGDGGAAGPAYSRRSQGELRVIKESNNFIFESYAPGGAPFPGGGGSGGESGITRSGDDGMVIIRY